MSTEENTDPFAALLTGKDREAYEAFGVRMREWLLDNVDARGADFADILEAAAAIFASSVASYVSACVVDQKNMDVARRCTHDIVAQELTRCFDQIKLSDGFASKTGGRRVH